jgi:hypothetical protein
MFGVLAEGLVEAVDLVGGKGLCGMLLLEDGTILVLEACVVSRRFFALILMR